MLATWVASSAKGEPGSAKPDAIGVTVSDVADNRAQFGECRVMLSLTGDAVADAQEVRRIRITTARDELGRDLIKPVEPSASPTEPGLTGITIRPSPAEEQRRLEVVAGEVARRRALREGQPVSSAPVPTLLPSARASIKSRPSISLRNPSRQSASIKIIEGEIELYAPSETNGGVVRLKDPFEKPATFLTSDALKAAAVQLMYLVPETYAKDRAEAGREAPVTTGPWSEEVATTLKGFAAMTSKARPSYVVFFLDDPNRLVVDFELQDKEGKRLDRGPLRMSAAQLRGLTLDAPPPADAQLVLRVAVPGALTAYPFKLENIPLP